MRIKNVIMRSFMKSIVIFSTLICIISREGICFFIYHENDFTDELRKY